MTYKIKYLPLAVQDLNDIARYLSGSIVSCAVRGIYRSIWNKNKRQDITITVVSCLLYIFTSVPRSHTAR